ncbi:hypothetical protein [Aeoliella sp.]|uniref:hypothetical protein n=1 Tax=Aeoliella sp. TaxID=2795800 RepID=UPI003CCC0AC4
MNCRYLLSVIVVGCCLVQTSEASIKVWSVTSTAVNAYGPGPTPAPHGLWTNDFMGGTGYLNYFDIQPGTTLTQYMDGTAKLSGTAKNLADTPVTATLDLTLGGFQTALANPSQYKAGGGPYDPTNQDFYSTLSGTITFDDGKGTVTIQSVIPGTFFQMGLGANDKNGDFGASAWIIPEYSNGTPFPNSRHWDLNLNLSPVPEASSIFAWTMVLGGIGLIVYRQQVRGKSAA